MAITAIVGAGVALAGSTAVSIVNMENQRIAGEKAKKQTQDLIDAQNQQNEQMQTQYEEQTAKQDKAIADTQNKANLAAQRENRRARARASYGGTLLTGPKGLASTTSTEKTLLGS